MLLMVWDIIPVGSIPTNNKQNSKKIRSSTCTFTRGLQISKFPREYWNLQNKRETLITFLREKK
jgi:hypothetical protein